MASQEYGSSKNTGLQPRPFVKWAEGRRQLLGVLHGAAPVKFGRYFETFIGGGAFLFSQSSSRATISEVNLDVINCYQVIRDDVDALIESLQTSIAGEMFMIASTKIRWTLCS